VLIRVHCCCCALPQADWDIVKRGWQAHVLGKAPHTFTDPVQAVKTLRVRMQQQQQQQSSDSCNSSHARSS
jgi:hypothetical protein